MPINTKEVIKLLDTLAREEKLKVTIKRCVVSGAIIGVSSAVSALLLGPIGLALGGIISGCATAFSEKDKFQSAVEILSDMSPEKRETLAESVRRIAESLDATDIVVFTALLNGNTTIRRQVVNELLNFLSNEVIMAVDN